MFDIVGSIVAAVVSMILGFLWYSDALFGKSWRREMGYTPEDEAQLKNQNMTKPIIGGVITEFVTAMVFSYFFFFLGIVGVGPALAIGFWAWLGFSATLQYGMVLWAKHSTRLFFINTTHRLVSFLLIALVLALF